MPPDSFSRIIVHAAQLYLVKKFPSQDYDYSVSYIQVAEPVERQG